MADASPLDSIMAQLQAQVSANTPQGPLANLNPLWLGLAQGLSAPTRTGSFGEAMNNAITGVQAPLSNMRKENMSALEKIAALQESKQRMDQQARYWDARASHYENMGSAPESLSQKRLITEGLLKELGSEFDPDSDNPLTMQKYADENEWAQLRNQLRKQYFELGGFGPTAALKKTDTGEATPKDDSVGPASYPNAKQAPDGNFYIPDPKRPGKYLKVE
jgi:hypothetical protein